MYLRTKLEGPLPIELLGVEVERPTVEKGKQ